MFIKVQCDLPYEILRRKIGENGEGDLYRQVGQNIEGKWDLSAVEMRLGAVETGEEV